VLNFFALKYLQLDQVLSIMFSTPFFVAILAGPMLGDGSEWRRWSAIGVGLSGRASAGEDCHEDGVENMIDSTWSS